MARIVFLYILPIVTPIIVYAIWVSYNVKSKKLIDYKKKSLFLFLAIAISFTGIVGLLLSNMSSKNTYSEDSTYVKATYKDGKIIPAHAIKKEK